MRYLEFQLSRLKLEKKIVENIRIEQQIITLGILKYYWKILKYPREQRSTKKKKRKKNETKVTQPGWCTMKNRSSASLQTGILKWRVWKGAKFNVEPRFSRVARLVISRASISRRIYAANYARGGDSKSEKSSGTRKPVGPILPPSFSLFLFSLFFPPPPVSRRSVLARGSEVAGSKNYRCYRITAHDNGRWPCPEIGFCATN